MGNGGLTPDNLQGKLFIVPALNKMFDPAAGLPDTRDNFKHLKKFYKHLGEDDPQSLTQKGSSIFRAWQGVVSGA